MQLQDYVRIRRTTSRKFTARIGEIKDVNGKTLTEEKDVTYRWFECTKKLYEVEKEEEYDVDWADLEPKPEPMLNEGERTIKKNKAPGIDNVIGQPTVRVRHRIC